MTVLATRRTGNAGTLPFLLLHAMPLDSTMWDLVRDRLAPIDVVTVDAPGFGGSPSGAELQERYGRPEPSLEAFVEAIRESLDELEVERVVLGGMSMGGTVAATFAQTYPERVAGLALMDTNIGVDDADHAAIRRESIALCEEGKGYESVKEWSNFLVSPASPESVRQSLDRRFRLFNSASLAWLQRALLDRDSAIGALTAIDGPILLERGADDATCSFALLQQWKELAPHAKIIEIPGAGHFVADEQPEVLAKALADFYRQAA